MEKIIWKKGIVEGTGRRVIRAKHISIFCDEIEQDSISYDVLYKGKLNAILYKDSHEIEGE